MLSTKRDESLKFIFRIPSRDNHYEEYGRRFAAYLHNVNLAKEKQAQNGQTQGAQPGTKGQSKAPPSVKPMLLQGNPFGMHWSGGEKYNVTGHLGKGAFATVYRLNSKSNGQMFAAKELEKRRFMKNGVIDKKLDNELRIMKGISHPHVVQYIDCHDVKNHLYIIMELVPFGDLQQWLGTNGPLPEALAKPMAIQVFDALAYLHRNMITHRDIKPDNILIADTNPQSFTVKLSDFGLSKVISDSETFLKTFCGTLLYCAPEVFPHYDAHFNVKGRKRDRKGASQQRGKYHSYSSSVDIWSFGGVLWYAMSTKPPFEGIADNTGKAMFERIVSTSLDTTVLEKHHISEDAIDLLEDMLNTDPAIRPSALQCLSYPWLGGDASQILDEPPSGLLTIEEEDAEGGAAHDLSQLSIHGKWNTTKAIGVDSGDSDILDPRQSKRFKSGQIASQAPAPSQQPVHFLRPTNFAEESGVQELPANSQLPRLFGEVQPSLVKSSGVFGTQLQKPMFASPAGQPSIDPSKAQNAQNELFTSAASHQPEDQLENARTRGPSENDIYASHNFASLVGAESDMRDLNMDSSQSAFSATADESEPTTPTTPNDAPQASVGQTGGSMEETPRPAHPVERKISFNRQISLPLSASSFYDPADPSTHSLEYASSVSGHDFTGHNLLPGASFHSLPPTTANSGIDFEFDRPLHTVAQTQPEFIRPAPRLGRLTTTSDSFCAVTLDLATRITTWGRSPLNTVIFPDPLDTRVPKRGIMIYFHAKGIDKVERNGGDWTKLSDLHCLIATDSSNGIFINDVKLNAKDAKGNQLYGRVYTGDEVTVCQGHTKANLLKFTCAFNHGEAKEQRINDDPGFEVEQMGHV
jgi:serine/threonine protein kinase